MLTFRIFLFNSIFYFSILFFGLLFLPILFSKKYTRKVIVIWSKSILFALKKIIKIQIKFDNKYIMNNKGLVIAANHQSAFDTIFFLAAFDKVIYIIKKELIFIPIYGWYALRLGNIFVDRKKKIESIKKLSKRIKELINNEYKVVIFPEGTRQPANKIGEIKPGIYLLQSKLKDPIYPVYIDSGKAWPKDSFNMRSKDIYIKSIEPILFGLSKKDFKKKLKNVYEENIIKR